MENLIFFTAHFCLFSVHLECIGYILDMANAFLFTGDVIAVEKPFASVLLPEYFTTHCYNCLQRCEALLPCCFCSNVSMLVLIICVLKIPANIFKINMEIYI